MSFAVLNCSYCALAPVVCNYKQLHNVRSLSSFLCLFICILFFFCFILILQIIAMYGTWNMYSRLLQQCTTVIVKHIGRLLLFAAAGPAKRQIYALWCAFVAECLLPTILRIVQISYARELRVAVKFDLRRKWQAFGHSNLSQDEYRFYFVIIHRAKISLLIFNIKMLHLALIVSTAVATAYSYITLATIFAINGSIQFSISSYSYKLGRNNY